MRKLLVVVAITLVTLAVLTGVVGYLVLKPHKSPALVADMGSMRFLPQGALVGAAVDEASYAWLGIPYAESTAGEGRWRAPRAPQAWPGVFEALAYSPPCPQLWNRFSGGAGSPGDIVGDEDCLALNIWAPRPAEDQSDAAEPLPVMVWIHGGGNTAGSSSSYPAAVLAGAEEVVVVVINYRLGLLGWFSQPAVRAMATDPVDASGNFGTLDTIAALRWVQDNIAAFGGDPGNVTVFGESAGGRNVAMLLASPLAKGLFQRAIVQSGSINSMPRQFAENYVDDTAPGMDNSSAEIVVRLLQSESPTLERAEAKQQARQIPFWAMNEFLRSRTVKQLFNAVAVAGDSYIAPQTIRDGLVLPSQPLTEVFRDPQAYNAVPLITGSNRDEQKLFLAMRPEHAKLWFGVLPQIRDQRKFDKLSAYYSDRWRLAAVNVPGTIIVDNGGPPVYSYRWDWDEGGRLGFVDWSTTLGAAHGLEVPFILGNFEDLVLIPRIFTAGNREGRELLSRQMMSYWAQFARSGDPGRGGSGELLAWRAWEPGRSRMMVFDTAADGGNRMQPETLTVDQFHSRIAADSLFENQRQRCKLYADLFYSPQRGRELFDPPAYSALGCQDFDVEVLSLEK